MIHYFFNFEFTRQKSSHYLFENFWIIIGRLRFSFIKNLLNLSLKSSKITDLF